MMTCQSPKNRSLNYATVSPISENKWACKVISKNNPDLKRHLAPLFDYRTVQFLREPESRAPRQL